MQILIIIIKFFSAFIYLYLQNSCTFLKLMNLIGEILFWNLDYEISLVSAHFLGKLSIVVDGYHISSLGHRPFLSFYILDSFQVGRFCHQRVLSLLSTDNIFSIFINMGVGLFLFIGVNRPDFICSSSASSGRG